MDNSNMKVLIATDGSRSSELAFDHVISLIREGRLHGGDPASAADHRSGPPEIVVVTVSRGTTSNPADYPRSRATLAHSLAEPAAAISNLARAKEILTARGLAAKHLWRVGEDPVETIIETAVDEHADLIVLGCRPRPGRPDEVTGSVSNGVLRTSPIPVLVVKDRLAG
jgi:nucleotide-binding universal stress UspA family protein